MASSAGNAKQKKGPPLMYVYKLDTGNQKPPESGPPVKKSTVSRSWGLGIGSLRRSKTVRETVHRIINHKVEEERGGLSVKEIVTARKSVSSEASAARNSVSELELVDRHRRIMNNNVKEIRVLARKSASSEAAARKSLSELEFDRRKIVMNNKVVVEDVKEIDTNIVEARKSVSSEAAAARKSVSHLEVNAAAVGAFLQVKVLVTDMPGFMQVHAFRCARNTYDSLEKFSSKHMAYNLKKEFDKVYGPAWHCIVGSSFGSFVTHSTGGFLYFSMEKLHILVFKTKVQRALDDS